MWLPLPQQNIWASVCKQHSNSETCNMCVMWPVPLVTLVTCQHHELQTMRETMRNHQNLWWCIINWFLPQKPTPGTKNRLPPGRGWFSLILWIWGQNAAFPPRKGIFWKTQFSTKTIKPPAVLEICVYKMQVPVHFHPHFGLKWSNCVGSRWHMSRKCRWKHVFILIWGWIKQTVWVPHLRWAHCDLEGGLGGTLYRPVCGFHVFLQETTKSGNSLMFTSVWSWGHSSTLTH